MPAVQVQKKGAVQDNSSGSSITATFDVQPTQFNVLIAIHVGGGGWVNAGASSISGTGWTRRISQSSPGAPPESSMAVWTKVAGASEPTVVTADVAQQDSAAFFLYEYSGLEGGNLIDSVGTNESNATNTQHPTAQLSTSIDTIIIASMEHRNGNGDQLYGLTNGWTKEFDLAANGGGGTNEFNACSATVRVGPGFYSNTFTWPSTSGYGSGMSSIIALRELPVQDKMSVYDGASFISGKPRIWDGGAWIEGAPRVYDGAVWIPA